jgi:lipopolysaccharide export system permease protein
MKKIIFTKISSDCLKFFLLTVFSIATIIWVMQAVNFLDFIVEDGHGFFVYLNYTLLSFPKIFSKIFLFVFFFSICYVLIKYENKNELVIFWNIGVHKLKFVKYFIKFSFLFVIINLILNSFVVPKTQDLGRSFIRSSNLDLYEGIIKPKKFITATKDLTIFVDNKTAKGELVNIFLKENSSNGNFQIIFAKTGRFETRGKRKILVLNNGKTINNKNNTLSGFEFSKSDFNLSKFNSKTTSSTKTQENSTLQLFQCIINLKQITLLNIYNNNFIHFDNCKIGNLKNIFKELYKRLIIPFYNPLLMVVALLLVLKSKSNSSFKLHKLKVFTLGFVSIILSEIASDFVSLNIYKNIFITLLPFMLFFLIYIYFKSTLRQN